MNVLIKSANVEKLRELACPADVETDTDFVNRIIVEGLIFRAMMKSSEAYFGKEFEKKDLDAGFCAVKKIDELASWVGGETEKNAARAYLMASSYFIKDFKDSHREADIYKHVESLVLGRFPDARKEDIVSVKGHIPDAFFRIDNALIPVEVKRGGFDEKAKRQLRRYIRVYGAPFGIGIAQTVPGCDEKDIVFLAHGEDR